MTLYPGHDAGEALESDCCDCYKGGREWVWTLSDLRYLRAMTAWLPGPVTTVTSSQDSTSSWQDFEFPRKFPRQTRDPGL